MSTFRPIIKEIEQESLDMNRLFYLLKHTKIEDKTLIDKMFTEWGQGYINSLSSKDRNIPIILEKEYFLLKRKYEALLKENEELKKFSSKNFLNNIYKYLKLK